MKKEACAPPKAKAKALKAKKRVLKSIHNHTHTHKIYVTYLPTGQDTVSPEAAQIPSKECPPTRRNVLDHYAIIKFPLILSQP